MCSKDEFVEDKGRDRVSGENDEKTNDGVDDEPTCRNNSVFFAGRCHPTVPRVHNKSEKDNAKGTQGNNNGIGNNHGRRVWTLRVRIEKGV